MINTEIIYKALKSDLSGNLDGNCCVCGRHTEKGFKAKDYIKNARFTNFDLLKKPSSDVICECCGYCMQNADLRRKNFIADCEHIEFLSKNPLPVRQGVYLSSICVSHQCRHQGHSLAYLRHLRGAFCVLL